MSIYLNECKNSKIKSRFFIHNPFFEINLINCFCFTSNDDFLASIQTLQFYNRKKFFTLLEKMKIFFKIEIIKNLKTF